MSVEAASAVDAFRQLFEEHASYLWVSLRRLGVADRDLEDLTHEVLLAVHKRLPQYDRSRPLRPWLFAFAARFASDYRRLVRHEREIASDDTEIVDDAPPADERIAQEQTRRLVIEALDSLDLDRRTVLVMHDLDGYVMPEVATALGIPLNTAYTRLRTAREQFKAAAERLRLRRGER